MDKNVLFSAINEKIHQKTKPVGSLGRLEKIALQVALWQNTLSPSLQKPTIVVFAGDHGIAEEGVSAYPQEVTYQMVYNFLKGGAAINVFARQHQIELYIVDAGVKHVFPTELPLFHHKIGWGTKNFLYAPAMSREELEQCLQLGASVVAQIAQKGTNVIGFGEMGIGNTSSASAMMSLLLEVPIQDCVGAGTGLNEEQIRHKIRVLYQAINHHKIDKDPYQVLQYFGGFEIAQMVGAMQEAYRRKMLILIDGFIASVAFLVAYLKESDIIEAAIFCHQSAERGHQLLLKKLNAEPILNLEMRLGEGTGCAVAYPIVESAVRFLNEMASFQEAKVSSKIEK